MLKRVMPVLLLKGNELYKSVKFKNHTYIGDALNTMKIFNELEADELVLFDIAATNNRKINFELIQDIASECFVPLTYGGGISEIEQIEQLLTIGIEKICISSASENLEFIKQAVEKFGSSTICVCVDYRQEGVKRIVYFKGGSRRSRYDVEEFIKILEELQIGEIIVQNIDREGTYSGCDIELLENIAKSAKNPIIITGGVKDKLDVKKAFDAGAAGVAAGSLFVYYSKMRGILVNYFDLDEMKEIGLKR